MKDERRKEIRNEDFDRRERGELRREDEILYCGGSKDRNTG